MAKRLGIAEALREAIGEEMQRDQRVFCIGEDIAVPGGWGGAFTVTLGLEKEFPDRMINTPIAELGFFGVACGAAMMGTAAHRRRPVRRFPPAWPSTRSSTTSPRCATCRAGKSPCRW